MKNIFSLLFQFILIYVISKIFCQFPSKNFILPLNYSFQNNLYYIQLYLGEKQIQKNFGIDITSSSILYYFNNSTYKENCSISSKCYINSKILINDVINTNKDKTNGSISFNADIEYIFKIEMFSENESMSEIDGKIGLNNDNNSIVDILYNLNIINEKMFSICLSQKIGYLGFGQLLGFTKNLELQQENNFINILPSIDNSYKLNINYIKINNIKIEEEFNSYLDFSKSHTFFPSKLFDQIITYLLLINNNLEQDPDFRHCSIVDIVEKNKFYQNFPEININFENYIFVWKPKNYFSEHSTNDINKIKLCLSFYELKNDNNSEIILGTDFMMDYQIIFDKTNQKISFINTDCNTLFYNDYSEPKNNEKSQNSNNIIDSIEYYSNVNDINEEYLSSSVIENKEENEENEENFGILTSEIISSDLSDSNNIIISDNSDFQIYETDTDKILHYSSNLIDNAYEENIIDTTNYHNIPTTHEIIPTIQKIVENNIEIVTTEKINIDTTISLKKAETTIVEENLDINKTPTTIINTVETNIIENKEEPNTNKIKETDINQNGSENETHENNDNNQLISQHNEKNSFYGIIKSFLKNKLIYFILAFLGVVLGFVAIIFISCAFISCVKFIRNRRRDYMEQIDVEVQKYSRGNNMSSFSDRVN